MKTMYFFTAALFSSLFAQSQKVPDYISNPGLELKNPGKSILNELVFIPGGTFKLDGDQGRSPSQLVTLNSFYIQNREVTNLWYRRFLHDVAKTEPAKAILLLPDTLSWVNDFSYSYNEPLKLNYFQNEAYNNYPVVGVNFTKANAFCEWANQKVKAYISTLPAAKQVYGEVRLPSAAEWQYAASGGLERTCYGFDNSDKWLYDCGVFGLYDAKKKLFRGNYKTDEGNFISDRCFQTCPVMSYAPNPYGLYDMVGNVSEWVSDVFIEYNRIEGTNPAEWKSEIKEGIYTLKGGSWADMYKDQYISRRKPLHADSTHCYVGFRLIASFKKD
ncbi:MAG: formylglycine-generating enzyme family protein [Flavobacteriales bacterium]|nr:formylglycine-generating enzyme family protein [Flavobacteriales bacterium]